MFLFVYREELNVENNRKLPYVFLPNDEAIIGL